MKATGFLVLIAFIAATDAGILYATSVLPQYHYSPYALDYSYIQSTHLVPHTYAVELKHHHPGHKEDKPGEDNNKEQKSDDSTPQMPQTTNELKYYTFSYPITYAIPTPLTWPTSSQFHVQDELGQYHYGYTSTQSSKQELKTLDGITQGSYTYIDSNGLVQTVKYLSDASGFHVAATNLPKPAVPVEIPDSPEVALAKEKHVQAQNEALSRLNAANSSESSNSTSDSDGQ